MRIVDRRGERSITSKSKFVALMESIMHSIRELDVECKGCFNPYIDHDIQTTGYDLPILYKIR